MRCPGRGATGVSGGQLPPLPQAQCLSLAVGGRGGAWALFPSNGALTNWLPRQRGGGHAGRSCPLHLKWELERLEQPWRGPTQNSVNKLAPACAASPPRLMRPGKMSCQLHISLERQPERKAATQREGGREEGVTKPPKLETARVPLLQPWQQV